MPKYVTIKETKTTIFKIDGQGMDDKVAKEIAMERFNQKAPIDLIFEESKISKITVSDHEPTPAH